MPAGCGTGLLRGQGRAVDRLHRPGRSRYTVLATSPVTEEEPFLYTDSGRQLQRLRARGPDQLVGPSWASGTEAGTLDPDPAVLHRQPEHARSWRSTWRLALGQNLILTPGVYDLDQPIVVSRPNTVVLGLGFATLVPQQGNAAMIVTRNQGVKVSGLIIDAGPVNSPVLMDVGCTSQTSFGQGWLNPGAWGFGCGFLPPFGSWGSTSSASDPDLIQDVFFRIGGAETTPDQRHGQPHGQRQSTRSSTTSGHGAPTTAARSAGRRTRPTPGWS